MPSGLPAGSPTILNGMVWRGVLSMRRSLRFKTRALPAAILATSVALSVAFLPLGIERLLQRRKAKPIKVVAPPDAVREAPPGQVCRAPDAISTRFVSDLRLIAASTGSAWGETRAELQIPHADSTMVLLLADERTCRAVLSAFNTTLAGEWPSGPPASLYVAKVGEAYVGMVPGPPDGSVLVHTVVSSRFEVLSKFAK